MNSDQKTIQEAKQAGYDACASYVKAWGWNKAKNHLNTECPINYPNISNSTWGFWIGWSNWLIDNIKLSDEFKKDYILNILRECKQ